MRLNPILLLTMAVVASATAAAAQTTPDMMATENSAAAYIGSHLAKGRVLFDTSTVAAGTSTSEPRSVTQDQTLARAMNATIGRAADSPSCPSAHNAQCDIVGYDVVIEIGRPRIQGDTAVVMVRRFFHGVPGVAVMSSANYQLRLLRQRSQWVVVEAHSTSIS